MRSIKDVINENERVWFSLSEENKKDFVNDVNELGLKFCSGESLTYENCGSLMAITNKTVAYISYHVWFLSFDVESFHAIRINYEQYRLGYDGLITHYGLK